MLTCFLSLFALLKLVVQRRKLQKILLKKRDVVWMIRHFTHQLFSYGFVAYKQCKSLKFVFSLFFFLMSQHVSRSYWKLKGFITGFHIYTSTFSVKSFPLSKNVFGEHLFIGQQWNGANNLFDINCHTRIRNGSRLFFILCT